MSPYLLNAKYIRNPNDPIPARRKSHPKFPVIPLSIPFMKSVLASGAMAIGNITAISNTIAKIANGLFIVFIKPPRYLIAMYK